MGAGFRRSIILLPMFALLMLYMYQQRMKLTDTNWVKQPKKKIIHEDIKKG